MTPGPIEQAFWQWHAENPQVYRELVSLARRLRERGHTKIGIGMLFEVLRWRHAMRTRGDGDGFKLNNNYRALYARLIMQDESDLAGVFEIRRIQDDEPFGQQRLVVPPVGHVAPPYVVPAASTHPMHF